MGRLLATVAVSAAVAGCGTTATPNPADVTCRTFLREPSTQRRVLAAIAGDLLRHRAMPTRGTADERRQFIRAYAATWCTNSRTGADHPYPQVATDLRHVGIEWP